MAITAHGGILHREDVDPSLTDHKHVLQVECSRAACLQQVQ